MSKSTLKILPALLVAITAVFVTQPVFSVTDHQLVLTENSSTSLLAYYDNTQLMVTFIGPDEWDVALPTSVRFGGLAWFEPGTTSAVNSIELVVQLRVDSDAIAGGNPAPNGFTYVATGTDSSDNRNVDVTFNDNGDVAAVPDTGSTFALLSLALAASLGASRFRALRLI